MEHYLSVTFEIVALLLIFRLMALPIRLIWKLVINLVCGFSALILINLLGSGLGITLSINLISVAAVALLGLPGVGLLLMVRLFLV